MLGGRGLVAAAGRTASGRVSLTKCQRRHSYANAQLLVCANNAHQHQYEDFYSGRRYPKWLTRRETASVALALGVFTASAHYAIKKAMAKKQRDDDSSAVSKELQDSNSRESTSTSDTATMATSSIAAATTTFDDGWCEALQEFLSEQTAQFRERLESKESFPERYHTSVGALQGDRPYMEDTFVVGDEGRFVAVFDGHGGSKVSSFLQDRLYGAFLSNLQDVQQGRGKTAAPLHYTIRALRSTFDEMEQQVLKIRSMHNEGSTAVAVALHQDERTGQRTLVSANVGDSRAVLCRNGQALDLTQDHKADSTSCHAAEWDEIDGIYRIHGLAIARSIGDRYAKPDVSGQAEIKTHPVDPTDEFVVVASDGLWDVMSSQAVVDYIREKLQEGTDKEETKHLISDMLAEEAWIQGSTDNICVAIVWL